MFSMYENYVNGNLTDSIRQAKRFGRVKIREFLISEFGLNFVDAQLIVDYLKGDSK